MKSFLDVIVEANKPKSQVLLFGRMNPPTQGHEENVMNAHKLATKQGASLAIVGSHSTDASKNPLSPQKKMKHLKRAFGHLPNTSIGTSSPESPSILHQAVAAHNSGVRNLIVAGGGDRAGGHLKLLQQYNGVRGKSHGYYKFDSITGVNTGARKSGISGTDMRNHVRAGNYDKFKANLPSRIAANEKHSQEVYDDVRRGMAVKEGTDRESYIQGLSFNLHELVEDNLSGLTGYIVYRGPTYVTVQLDESTTVKRWIEDITPLVPANKDVNMNNFKSFIIKEATSETEDGLSEEDLRDLERQIEAMSDDELSKLAEAVETNELDRPTSSLEDIAAKHKVSLDYLKKQLEAGIKVEHEHAKELSMAKEIALDHLGEKPDYYEKLSAAHLEENLTQAQRMKKKMVFLKSKAKRQIARRIAMKRMSTQSKLKKKSIRAAKMVIQQKLLRGRDKSKLSAAEKNRIENIITKAKPAILRISNKLMPKIRQVEIRRLRKMEEQLGTDRINRTELDIPGPDKESTGHEMADKVKRHLAGARNPNAPQQGHDIDPANTMRRLKHFRKLEV